MPRLPHATLWLALLAPVCLAARAEGSETEKPRFGWATRAEINALPSGERPRLDPTCPGIWITPIPPTARVGDPTLSNIEVEADDVHYELEGTSTLRGRVAISQPGRRIEADQAELTRNQNEGSFSGNILIAEPGLVLTGDEAQFDFQTQQARIRRTEFVSSAINARGRADEIQRNEEGLLTIARGEYSTCPPDDRTWSFEARNIRLNQKTGRGEVRNAILNIQDVPVLYVPYFNFPIDDRRQTGILIPRFGTTNDGGLDFALPIYVNLAPNYDATLTPRIMSRRGSMMEGEFRYLLPRLGAGQISGGYLPDDDLYDERDRKSLSWRQNGQVAPSLQLNTNFNYVSDSAYFIDLGTDLNITNTVFQERAGELIYTREDWSLLGRVQSFQTIDPQITDIDKPYARLPQLLFSAGHHVARGWQPGLRAESVYFERRIDDGSGPEVNGARLRIDPALDYVLAEPWGFVNPGIKLRTLGYELTGAGVAGNSDTESVASTNVSLDSGLIFERSEGSFTQTLEPRAYYLFAPYTEQGHLPNFDTATSTFSFQQLFRESRFSGGDRLDDANQLSLGLTSRVISTESGEEVIRASIGQIQYFRPRKVRLDATQPIDQAGSSNLAAQLAAPIGRGWSSTADALWTPNLDHTSQLSVNFNYLPEARDRLANIGYNFRREDPVLGQEALRQANFSLIQPVRTSWQLLALLQYDLRNNEAQESLLGVQYEACCWKLRLFDRRFLADPDDISPGARRERHTMFLEVELKGLAGISSGVQNLLSNNVFGYNQLAEPRGSRQESR